MKLIKFRFEQVIEQAFQAVMAKEPARQEALRVQREAERAKRQAADRLREEEHRRREEKRCVYSSSSAC